MTAMDVQAPALQHSVGKAKRYLIVGIGAIIGILALLVMFSIFFKKTSVKPYIAAVVAQQEELLRVNELIDKYNPSLSTRQIRASVGAIVGSDMKRYEEVLGDYRSDSKNLDLNVVLDNEAKSRYEQALARNNIDMEYLDTISKHLAYYKDSLQQLSSTASQEDVSQLTKESLDHVEALSDMLIAS